MAKTTEHPIAPTVAADGDLASCSEATEVTALIAALVADPRTAGRLVDLQPTQPAPHAHRLFLGGIWSDGELPVLVKLGASPWELHWMLALGEQAPELVPRVLAGGEHLGERPLRWLVLEHVPHLLSAAWGAAWGDHRFDLLAEVAVRFQAAAQQIDRRFVGMEDRYATRRWLELGVREGCPGPLTGVLDRLESDWEWVQGVCGLEVCFGDLHTGNALCRTPPPAGERLLLIDPIPRVAPWAWDAAYCQALCSTADVRMVQRMAELRRRHGLHAPVGAELERLAALMLAWLGALWWGIAPWRRDDGAWREQIRRYVAAAAAC